MVIEHLTVPLPQSRSDHGKISGISPRHTKSRGGLGLKTKRIIIDPRCVPFVQSTRRVRAWDINIVRLSENSVPR